MVTELIVFEHDGRTETVRVPDEGLTIGRKPPPYGASYCTTNGSISRVHCRFARLGDGWYVEDLGSANGTAVNGEHVEGQTPLRNGDVVTLGGSDGVRAQLVVRGRERVSFAELMFDESLESMVEPTDPVGARARGLPLEDEQTQFATREPIDRIRSTYDIVAAKYATELADAMIARPIERGLMLAFAQLVTALGDGVVGDVGCGPGQIAKHLATLGVATLGIDVSAAMIEQAKRKHPDGDFRVGSMFELPVLSGAWLGAVAMFSTLHFNGPERARALSELYRTVRAGGYVLHGFYVSAPDQPSGSMYHLEHWFGFHVDLDTYFVAIDDAADEMDRAGFDVIAATVREPMSPSELPARRCYMLGQRR